MKRNLKIRYDYGQMVTEEHRTEEHASDLLDEDKLSDELVPDPHDKRSMVSMSAEVYICFSHCHKQYNYLHLITYRPFLS